MRPLRELYPDVTVACVWVQGNVPYPQIYVERLASMVRRHFDHPHRFVCLTDRPHKALAGVEMLEIAPVVGAGWWSKLQLFNPANGLSGRVLYIDLDVLVVRELTPIALYPAAFVTVPDEESQFRPKSNHQVIRRFNSSVMAFDAGAYADLWTTFTPDLTRRLWGDQDRLAELHPDTPTFPRSWCPRLSSIGPAGEIPPEAIVVLAKKPKPIEAAAKWPWFAERWH